MVRFVLHSACAVAPPVWLADVLPGGDGLDSIRSAVPPHMAEVNNRADQPNRKLRRPRAPDTSDFGLPPYWSYAVAWKPSPFRRVYHEHNTRLATLPALCDASVGARRTASSPQWSWRLGPYTPCKDQ